MSMVNINKNILGDLIHIDDISDYVEKRLNKMYTFEDIIKYEEMSCECEDSGFQHYLEYKSFIVSSYVDAASKDYLNGVFLNCDCEDDDICTCDYDVKKLNVYIFSNLIKFFEIFQLNEMENGLYNHLALKRCAQGLFDMEINSNDSFDGYVKVKQALADKFVKLYPSKK